MCQMLASLLLFWNLGHILTERDWHLSAGQTHYWPTSVNRLAVSAGCGAVWAEPMCVSAQLSLCLAWWVSPAGRAAVWTLLAQWVLKCLLPHLLTIRVSSYLLLFCCIPAWAGWKWSMVAKLKIVYRMFPFLNIFFNSFETLCCQLEKLAEGKLPLFFLLWFLCECLVFQVFCATLNRYIWI